MIFDLMNTKEKNEKINDKNVINKVDSKAKNHSLTWCAKSLNLKINYSYRYDNHMVIKMIVYIYFIPILEM